MNKKEQEIFITVPKYQLDLLLSQNQKLIEQNRQMQEVLCSLILRGNNERG